MAPASIVLLLMLLTSGLVKVCLRLPNPPKFFLIPAALLPTAFSGRVYPPIVFLGIGYSDFAILVEAKREAGAFADGLC